MFTGLAAGFAVNANIRELYAGAAITSGVTAVALFAIANAAGRILWGFAFDRTRTAPVIAANLVFQAALLVLSPFILRSAAGLQTFAFLAGLNYGGVLVLYASASARRWGPERVGKIYGVLFSANIPASPAPALAGAVYDIRGSFTLPFLLIGAMLTGAAALVLALRRDLEVDSPPPSPTEPA